MRFPRWIAQKTATSSTPATQETVVVDAGTSADYAGNAKRHDPDHVLFGNSELDILMLQS